MGSGVDYKQPVIAIRALDCLPAALAFHKQELELNKHAWHAASTFRDKVRFIGYYLLARLYHAPLSWEYGYLQWWAARNSLS